MALPAAVGIGAASVNTTGSNDVSLPGTEAQKAFDLLHERFPTSSADGAQANIVFRAPTGEKITATGDKAAVETAVTELGHGNEQVAGVVDPFTAGAVSQDGTTACITVSYAVQFHEMSDTSKATLPRMLDGALHHAQDASARAQVSERCLTPLRLGHAAREAPVT
ncbi:MMPL family transporter [Streptomyces ipomoeae]|uniref:MMPL family transporter n=1 Tax=Streptomyces ipomoeae TaxID=103232 RepID=UPI001FD05C21|nr:MMPL family transporter [Streptomyces ipomoeae]MDX2939241.1 MMPL family transporter [Streptomyces ipomoeae]